MRMLLLCVTISTLALSACTKSPSQPEVQQTPEDVTSTPSIPEPVPVAEPATLAVAASPTNAAPAATELVN